MSDKSLWGHLEGFLLTTAYAVKKANASGNRTSIGDHIVDKVLWTFWKRLCWYVPSSFLQTVVSVMACDQDLHVLLNKAWFWNIEHNCLKEKLQRLLLMTMLSNSLVTWKVYSKPLAPLSSMGMDNLILQVGLLTSLAIVPKRLTNLWSEAL